MGAPGHEADQGEREQDGRGGYEEEAGYYDGHVAVEVGGHDEVDGDDYDNEEACY